MHTVGFTMWGLIAAQTTPGFKCPSHVVPSGTMEDQDQAEYEATHVPADDAVVFENRTSGGD